MQIAAKKNVGCSADKHNTTTEENPFSADHPAGADPGRSAVAAAGTPTTRCPIWRRARHLSSHITACGAAPVRSRRRRTPHTRTDRQLFHLRTSGRQRAALPSGRRLTLPTLSERKALRLHTNPRRTAAVTRRRRERRPANANTSSQHCTTPSQGECE